MGVSTQGFKVPWGMATDGRMVAAQKAVKGCDYKCPQCLSPLTFRAGKIIVKHFSHRAGSACSYESVLHSAAKSQILYTVRAWLHGRGKAPALLWPCKGISDLMKCQGHVQLPLRPEKVDQVELEQQVGPFRADVILRKNGKAVLAIEVLVTHEMTDRKRQKLECEWVELDAHAVLDEPSSWHPISREHIPSASPNLIFKLRSHCTFCQLVDYPTFRDEIKSIQVKFDRWVTRARDPVAAAHSYWHWDEMTKVIDTHRKATEAKWSQTNSTPPPFWRYGFDEEEEGDEEIPI